MDTLPKVVRFEQLFQRYQLALHQMLYWASSCVIPGVVDELRQRHQGVLTIKWLDYNDPDERDIEIKTGSRWRELFKFSHHMFMLDMRACLKISGLQQLEF